MLRWERLLHKHLRQPTKYVIAKQMVINEERRFSSIFGSIDCMHWHWKACPISHQWTYQHKDTKCSIILEAIGDQRLWILHAFSGLPIENNNFNVLDKSPLVRYVHDTWFYVDGNGYPCYYLLLDGITPNATTSLAQQFHSSPQSIFWRPLRHWI